MFSKCCMIVYILSGLNKEDDHYIILQFTLRLVNITGMFFNVVGLQEVIAYSIVN